jgi:tetratricopeptide (TPR) repeat protein
MPARLGIVAFLVALFASGARADDWATPTEVTIRSPMNQVQAVLTPAKDGRSGATAKIIQKGKPDQSYRLAAKWMHVDSLVFDDGTLLAFDHWHSLGYDNVVMLYERDGRVRWAKPLVELLGQSLVEQAPHSVSSIWWRRIPLEWTLAKDGRTVQVTLFDENHLRLALADGAATLVSVANLPDDPQRLLNRARALLSSGQDAAAIPVLERAMTKDPDFLEAFALFAETLQRAGGHQRVAEVFQHASARWTLPAKDPYGIANVHVTWARSLIALGRIADAERALRTATQAAPMYPNPALALADLLVKQGKTKDADATLDDFAARVQTASSYPDTYAILEIGDFYKDRNEPNKALAHYAIAYKRDEVTNQFLYARMSELYEKVGNNAEAIRITEQLIAHFDKLGAGFVQDAARARADLQRLQAKKP